MIDFLSRNWPWIVFLGAMLAMHAGHLRGGHGGGHAGHGGPGAGHAGCGNPGGDHRSGHAGDVAHTEKGWRGGDGGQG